MKMMMLGFLLLYVDFASKRPMPVFRKATDFGEILKQDTDEFGILQISRTVDSGYSKSSLLAS